MPQKGRGKKTAAADKDGFDIYKDMLAEVGVSASSRRKPVKRRKTVETKSDTDNEDEHRKRALRESERMEIARQQQERLEQDRRESERTRKEKATQVDWRGFEDSDEDEDSDVDWEDIDITAVTSSKLSLKKDNGPLEFTLGDEPEDGVQEESMKDSTDKRKITAIDRKIRLEDHKSHLIFLTSHYHTINDWCNLSRVHSNLRPLMTPLISEPLTAWKDTDSYKGARLFIDGLKKAQEMWKRKWNITKPGHSLQGAESGNLEKHYATDEKAKEEFINASSLLSGSRDLGAELFCAFFRSMGVEARLVVSLQPIPLSLSRSKNNLANSPFELGFPSSPPTKPLPPALLTPPHRSLHRPRFTAPTEIVVTEQTPTSRHSPTTDTNSGVDASPFPTVWLEAYSPAARKWICVSPLTDHTPNQPHVLEPPINDPYKNLTYVMAFNPEGTVRDITRRYAACMLAKTRRLRIESTKNGSVFLQDLLSRYEPKGGWDTWDRGVGEGRFAAETKEFEELDKAEGIPTAVGDFKDHPLYRLERWLRKDEILVRRKKIGDFLVSVGNKGKNKRKESIYPAMDVVKIKSPEQWYRLGRIVKEGCQPLRVLPPKKRKGEVNEDEADRPMFSEAQTELYVPPPIIPGMGVVPKNAYGNLDIFVRSMVPAGGIHIRHRLAAVACKALSIDYADAVTGFKFQGRGKPTNPTIEGVVIAEEFGSLVEGKIEELAGEEERRKDEERRKKALARWMTWLLRLRIRERVEGYDMDESTWKGKGTESMAFTGVGNDEDDAAASNGHTGGGFLPDDGTGRGGFLPDDDEGGGGGGGFVLDDDDEDGGGGSGGGGFIPEDEDPSHTGGGFLPESPQPIKGAPLPETSQCGFLPDSPPTAGKSLSDDERTSGLKQQRVDAEDDSDSELSDVPSQIDD